MGVFTFPRGGESGGGAGGGVSNLLALTDTPNTYADSAGFILAVAGDMTAVEFRRITSADLPDPITFNSLVLPQVAWDETDSIPVVGGIVAVTDAELGALLYLGRGADNLGLPGDTPISDLRKLNHAQFNIAEYSQWMIPRFNQGYSIGNQVEILDIDLGDELEKALTRAGVTRRTNLTAVIELQYRMLECGAADASPFVGTHAITTTQASGTTALVATFNAHGLRAGDYVTLSGMTQAWLNGSFLIYATTANTFTMLQPGHAFSTAADAGFVAVAGRGPAIRARRLSRCIFSRNTVGIWLIISISNGSDTLGTETNFNVIPTAITSAVSAVQDGHFRIDISESGGRGMSASIMIEPLAIEWAFPPVKITSAYVEDADAKRVHVIFDAPVVLSDGVETGFDVNPDGGEESLLESPVDLEQASDTEIVCIYASDIIADAAGFDTDHFSRVTSDPANFAPFAFPFGLTITAEP